MDESAPIRAIVIGVSVLLAIATISAVLMYYNTAKQMASNVGRGQDFASNYEQSIQDILTKGSYNVTGKNYVTGADVKNLLNYFYGDETVEINIIGFRYVNSNSDSYIPNTTNEISSKNISNNPNSNDIGEKDYNNVMKKILDNQKFTIQKVDNTTLTNGNIGMKITINGSI